MTGPVQIEHEGQLPGNATGNGNKLARVIAITSGKGGVGKSSLSLNLAIELSRLNNRVCLFDADTNLANINIMTGLTPMATLHDVLNGKKSLEEVLMHGPGDIKILPAASGIMDFISFNPLQQDLMIGLLKNLEQVFDYVLIDTAAGINETVLSFLRAAPETIVTLTTEPTSLTDAFSLLKVLKKQGFNQPVKVLVNKARSFASAKETLARFSGALKKYLAQKVVSPGYVLEDQNVARSIMQQQPFALLYAQSPASYCVRNYALKIHTHGFHAETSLSEYFFKHKQKTTLHAVTPPSAAHLPWVDSLKKTIQCAPIVEVEDLMSVISSEWVKRLDREALDTRDAREEGFKAAIRFASRLNG